LKTGVGHLYNIKVALNGGFTVMAEKRANITLRCTECKNENYITEKNKRLHPNKFTTMKFCPHCNKMTLHEEKK
jgi:large subunit ribosomal protein L33